MGLKALAHAVLERNQAGNSQETTGRKQGNFRGVKPVKKFPDAFKYVACVNCTNLEKGYCTAWGHRPDVPEYEIRLCNKFNHLNGVDYACTSRKPKRP
jgi:hypothetical protein